MSSNESSSNSVPTQRSPLVTWLGLAVIALAVLVYLVVRPPGEATDPRRATEHPAVGAPLLGLSVEPLTGDGPPLRAADAAGKVVLLNIWGPWCGYCVAELPDLVAVAGEYAQRGDFLFLPITYGNRADYPVERLRQETRSTIQKLPGLTTTYHDPNQTTIQAISQVHAFDGRVPTTILLDRQSVIRAVWSGVVRREDLEFVLKEHWQ